MNHKITYELTVWIADPTTSLDQTIDAVGELIDSHLHKSFKFEDLEMRAIAAVEE
jgi:hypothetical protein